MHLKKIGHFDIKPHNIMLNKYGEAKLGDFGLSQELDVDLKERISTGYTLMYCSP